MKKIFALVVSVALGACALSPEYRAQIEARREAARHEAPLTPQLRTAIATSVKHLMDQREVLKLQTAKVVATSISTEATTDSVNAFKHNEFAPVYCVSVDIEGHTIFENHRKYAVFIEPAGGLRTKLSSFTMIKGIVADPCENDRLSFIPLPELMALF